MKKSTQLRSMIKKNAIMMPGAYNALVARQIEQAGFKGVYISGAGLSNSLGVRDEGILTLDDFVYAARWITRAVDVPVISDANTGFGNIGLTVQKFIEAGLAGLHIEDQVHLKKCGHLQGKEVIPYEEMVAKIETAVDARDKYDPDFLIIARTDARGAANIDEASQFSEAVNRGNRYLEAGADMIFPESLRSKDEFQKYRESVNGLLFANMTEFGKTPFIPFEQFKEFGYKVVIFPVSILRYHAKQTNMVLETINKLGNQQNLEPEMMTRDAINKLLSNPD